MFKRYFFALQYGPFRLAKWAILGAEKHHIALQYRLNRTAKWAILESEKNFFGLWYGVYQKTIRPGMASDMSDLTFLYISFAKIFCQNSVKKNCKSAARVSGKNLPFPNSTEYASDPP